MFAHHQFDAFTDLFTELLQIKLTDLNPTPKWLPLFNNFNFKILNQLNLHFFGY